MTDVAASPIFQARTMVLLVLLGIAGFLGMLILGAFAPDFNQRNNGGGHALSNSATGYSALVRLAEATGRKPRVVRNEYEYDTEDLLIVTPSSGSVDISFALGGRPTQPTLFVLPKWNTVPHPNRRGWVRHAGLTPALDPEGVLAPAVRMKIRQYRSGGRPLVTAANLPATIRFVAPRPVQVMTSIGFEKSWTDRRRAPRWTPLVTDGRGGTIIAKLGDGPVYVVSDPDILSNRGMKSLNQASSVLALLDWMNSTDAEGIAFDVLAAGLGRSKSPLKLIFEPPFLAATLTIAAAVLLAGLHALGRFGPIRAPGRAIAFGKAALVDNSAALIRKARREARLGGRYAMMVRERAAIIFGVPARLRGDKLDEYLNALDRRERFSDLADRAEQADNRQAALGAVQALHAWLKGGTT